MMSCQCFVVESYQFETKNDTSMFGSLNPDPGSMESALASFFAFSRVSKMQSSR